MSIKRLPIGAIRSGRVFLAKHWLGTSVILVATIVFFWPIIIRLGSYSPGGDAMFNAWEMARNQHCILRQHCPSYATANIFYPNKDSMLYSETQLSAGVVTLPIHFITSDPLVQYNVLTIISFFLAGWFMYLLAKYLSKGNEPLSLLAGLIFEFAPFKMAAIWHLQNLSIFCLPLAILLILKYFDSSRRKYLVGLFLTLLYVFFASWVQMVFVLVALGLLLAIYYLMKAAPKKLILITAGVIAVATLATAPLAIQYEQFSRSNHASFSFHDQELYNSSLADYFIPEDGTLIGKLYYKLSPKAIHNSYNLDSYSYHGLVLYAVAAIVIFVFYRKRRSDLFRRNRALFISLLLIGLTGFLISLGPLLKIKGSYTYPGLGRGIPVTIPAPYALVDLLLPQLSFIRAVGRASVLFLFMLCCLLVLWPAVTSKWPKKNSYIAIVIIWLLAIIELMPAHQVPMSNLSYNYNLSIPAVYQYVAEHNQIDDIAILRGNDDYPGAPFPIAATEDILWSGYYNRNIFNGYSGYFPPKYEQEYIDFINFKPSVVPEMKSLGLRYVIVDKLLSGPTSKKPYLLTDIEHVFPKVYQDKRYALFKIT